jgi:hypothetical protein
MHNNAGWRRNKNQSDGVLLQSPMYFGHMNSIGNAQLGNQFKLVHLKVSLTYFVYNADVAHAWIVPKPTTLRLVRDLTFVCSKNVSNEMHQHALQRFKSLQIEFSVLNSLWDIGRCKVAKNYDSITVRIYPFINNGANTFAWRIDTIVEASIVSSLMRSFNSAKVGRKSTERISFVWYNSL